MKKQAVAIALVVITGAVLIGFLDARAQSSDIKAQADELDTGMGWNVYFYVTKPVNSFEEVVPVLPAHMEFIHEIEGADVMVMGGQTTKQGDDFAGGNGLVVIRANSFEEAKEIADADPMHKTGVREYELYQWAINEGELTIRLNMSDQSFVIR